MFDDPALNKGEEIGRLIRSITECSAYLDIYQLERSLDVLKARLKFTVHHPHPISEHRMKSMQAKIRRLEAIMELARELRETQRIIEDAEVLITDAEQFKHLPPSLQQVLF